jgi:hypothetical protein
MAIGWLTILQNVPWTDVIRNAPKVADGAKKLWNAVGKKSPAADPLQAVVADLHAQMLASSELIKALADQNAELIKRIEVNEARVVWLARALIVTGVVAVVGVILALLQAV